MPATPATDLRLIEVFSSLQGEGVLIGRRQLFVRLAGCNLACAYCDTEHGEGAVWHAEREPGSELLTEHPNPAASQTLTGLIRDWQERWPLHHSMALTGGEPLLQDQALAGWLPTASQVLPIYLETNGTLPDPLERLLPFFTWISMDVKLAAVTGEPTPWAAHAAFLAAARPRTCQVKVVIDAQVPDDEVAAVARFVHRHGGDVPLVLQPKTVAGRPALSGRRLLALQGLAAREHAATLVIPQLHPLLAIR